MHDSTSMCNENEDELQDNHFMRMGRAKVNMEFIKNPKNRTKSFKSRTKILTKKAYELKTLCDVDVCMIIHGSYIEGHPMIVWPPERDTIKPLIESYNKQSSEDLKRRTIDVFDFLNDRNKKVEGDLARLRKNNDQSRFATWDERYERCSEAELREIVDALEGKLMMAKSRVEEIKSCNGAGAQNEVGSIHGGLVSSQRYSLESLLLKTRNMQLQAPHNQAQQIDPHETKFPISYYHPHQQLADNQQLNHTTNPMMMGNSPYSQLGPDHISNIYNNTYPVYFNDHPSTGMFENAGNNFSQPPPSTFYTPNMLGVPAYLQYMDMASSSSSQMNAMQMGMYYDFSNIHTSDKNAHRS